MFGLKKWKKFSCDMTVHPDPDETAEDITNILDDVFKGRGPHIRIAASRDTLEPLGNPAAGDPYEHWVLLSAHGDVDCEYIEEKLPYPAVVREVE